MISNDGLVRVNALLEEMIVALVDSANESAGDRAWKQATLDERISEFGSSSLAWWHITFCDGEQLAFAYPIDAAVCMTDIMDIRSECFTDADKFYGVFITVFPDGRSEVKFNYDPKCVKKMKM